MRGADGGRIDPATRERLATSFGNLYDGLTKEIDKSMAGLPSYFDHDARDMAGALRAELRQFKSVQFGEMREDCNISSLEPPQVPRMPRTPNGTGIA